MSSNQTVKILDSDGNPIEIEKKGMSVPVANRQSVAVKIFQYYTASAKDQSFIQGIIDVAASHIVNQEENDNQIHLSMDNPEIVNFCTNFAAQQIINSSLDENLPEAYGLALSFVTSPEYSPEDVLTLTTDDLQQISNHFSTAPEIQIALGLCAVQSELINLLNGTSGKNITSYQANRIQEKFEDLADYLNFEQKAAGYYNMSLMHRALLAEQNSATALESNAENECLKKVLEYTSDYKRINYCVNRLGDSKSNLGMIRAAYRRSLTATNVPADLYKIHTALAQCYLKDYRPTIGFYKLLSPYDKENDKLQKAELHYLKAFKYAQKPEQLNLLKNIAKLQLKQGKIDEWTASETKLAMQFLSGEERVSSLLEIASRNKDYQTEYLERALSETTRSRKIDTDKKKLLFNKIDHFLRPIYSANNNQEGLDNLDRLKSKYHSAPKGCPLLKYGANKKQRN